MTRFIAEIGSSHNGSLDRALKLVDFAAAAGFSDVKIQAWRLDKLFSPEALNANPKLIGRLAFEVPWEWHKPLANRAKQLGMGFGVSVFHKDHVRLAALEADWLKVSSYSLLDIQLLQAVAGQPKPMVVSTGMATEDEVADALAHIEPMHPELTLLHCVSAYPAHASEANLRSIPYMRERFGVPVGWSDHTCSGIVVGRAVGAFGASMVELHWDLGDGLGEEAKHSWTPDMFERLKEATTTNPDVYYSCDGEHRRKDPAESEWSERLWRADPSDGLRPILQLRGKLLAAKEAN